MNIKILFSLIKHGSISDLFVNIKKYNLVSNSGLFDSNFYSNNYNCGGLDPLIHYLFYGFKGNNIPSFNFDALKYSKEYMLDSSNQNPILHYLENDKRNNIEEIDQYSLLEDIISKNKEQLTNFKLNEPLVSIIILNKNGVNHLKNLFKDFKKNTNYDNYEIIVVDNNSSDESVNYLKSINDLPLKIIENNFNKSFSEANNQGFKQSNGDLILLMNNDMETTYGWLNELVGVLLNNENVGAVGPKLIYPYFLNERENSYTIQSAGDSFKDLMVGYNPYNFNKGLDIWDKSVNELKQVVGVTGATFLTTREIYEKVNGLDEDYYYCYEDVDFCLKLNKLGYKILYVPNSLIIHYESPTRKQDNNLRNIIKENRATLNHKWGDYLFKQIFNNKLEHEHFFTGDDLLISLISNGEDNNIIEAIEDVYEVDIASIDDINFGVDTDILLSFNSNYDPLNVILKNNALKIGWVIDNNDKWLEQIDFYDYIIYSNKELFDKNPNKNKCFIDVDNPNLVNEFKNNIKNYFVLS